MVNETPPPIIPITEEELQEMRDIIKREMDEAVYDSFDMIEVCGLQCPLMDERYGRNCYFKIQNEDSANLTLDVAKRIVATSRNNECPICIYVNYCELVFKHMCHLKQQKRTRW